MKTTNWTVYGMTPYQILKARDFWLKYHEELPKPEPTFKEVTMYAPVYREGLSHNLCKTKEEALGSLISIGYTEVKVFIKEREGADE